MPDAIAFLCAMPNFVVSPPRMPLCNDSSTLTINRGSISIPLLCIILRSTLAIKTAILLGRSAELHVAVAFLQRVPRRMEFLEFLVELVEFRLVAQLLRLGP